MSDKLIKVDQGIVPASAGAFGQEDKPAVVDERCAYGQLSSRRCQNRRLGNDHFCEQHRKFLDSIAELANTCPSVFRKTFIDPSGERATKNVRCRLPDSHAGNHSATVVSVMTVEWSTLLPLCGAPATSANIWCGLQSGHGGDMHCAPASGGGMIEWTARVIEESSMSIRLGPELVRSARTFSAIPSRDFAPERLIFGEGNGLFISNMSIGTLQRFSSGLRIDVRAPGDVDISGWGLAKQDEAIRVTVSNPYERDIRFSALLLGKLRT